MARLLRTTIGLLNTSSDTSLETSNIGETPQGWDTPLPQLHGLATAASQRGWGGFAQGLSDATMSPACLPQPQSMKRQEYLGSCLPLALLALLCLVQVYMYRLRRVIAAFYFPKVSGSASTN